MTGAEHALERAYEAHVDSGLGGVKGCSGAARPQAHAPKAVCSGCRSLSSVGAALCRRNMTAHTDSEGYLKSLHGRVKNKTVLDVSL